MTDAAELPTVLDRLLLIHFQVTDFLGFHTCSMNFADGFKGDLRQHAEMGRQKENFAQNVIQNILGTSPISSIVGESGAGKSAFVETLDVVLQLLLFVISNRICLDEHVQQVNTFLRSCPARRLSHTGLGKKAKNVSVRFDFKLVSEGHAQPLQICLSSVAGEDDWFLDLSYARNRCQRRFAIARADRVPGTDPWASFVRVLLEKVRICPQHHGFFERTELFPNDDDWSVACTWHLRYKDIFLGDDRARLQAVVEDPAFAVCCDRFDAKLHDDDVSFGTGQRTHSYLLASGGERDVYMTMFALHEKAGCVVVLDEPGQNLDAWRRRSLLHVIRSSCQDKRNQCVLITHHAELVDPFILLSKGFYAKRSFARTARWFRQPSTMFHPFSRLVNEIIDDMTHIVQVSKVETTVAETVRSYIDRHPELARPSRAVDFLQGLRIPVAQEALQCILKNHFVQILCNWIKNIKQPRSLDSDVNEKVEDSLISSSQMRHLWQSLSDVLFCAGGEFNEPTCLATALAQCASALATYAQVEQAECFAVCETALITCLCTWTTFVTYALTDVQQLVSKSKPDPSVELSWKSDFKKFLQGPNFRDAIKDFIRLAMGPSWIHLVFSRRSLPLGRVLWEPLSATFDWNSLPALKPSCSPALERCKYLNPLSALLCKLDALCIRVPAQAAPLGHGSTLVSVSKLRIRRVSLSNAFGRHSWSFEPAVANDLHCLVGPSGAGKSLMLEAIYVLLRLLEDKAVPLDVDALVSSEDSTIDFIFDVNGMAAIADVRFAAGATSGALRIDSALRTYLKEIGSITCVPQDHGAIRRLERTDDVQEHPWWISWRQLLETKLVSHCPLSNPRFNESLASAASIELDVSEQGLCFASIYDRTFRNALRNCSSGQRDAVMTLWGLWSAKSGGAVLLDEPGQNLDVNARRLLAEQLVFVASLKGLQLIIITHHSEVVRSTFTSKPEKVAVYRFSDAGVAVVVDSAVLKLLDKLQVHSPISSLWEILFARSVLCVEGWTDVTVLYTIDYLLRLLVPTCPGISSYILPCEGKWNIAVRSWLVRSLFPPDAHHCVLPLVDADAWWHALEFKFNYDGQPYVIRLDGHGGHFVDRLRSAAAHQMKIRFEPADKYAPYMFEEDPPSKLAFSRRFLAMLQEAASLAQSVVAPWSVNVEVGLTSDAFGRHSVDGSSVQVPDVIVKPLADMDGFIKQKLSDRASDDIENGPSHNDSLLACYYAKSVPWPLCVSCIEGLVVDTTKSTTAHVKTLKQKFGDVTAVAFCLLFGDLPAALQEQNQTDAVLFPLLQAAQTFLISSSTSFPQCRTRHDGYWWLLSLLGCLQDSSCPAFQWPVIPALPVYNVSAEDMREVESFVDVFVRAAHKVKLLPRILVRVSIELHPFSSAEMLSKSLRSVDAMLLWLLEFRDQLRTGDVDLGSTLPRCYFRLVHYDRICHIHRFSQSVAVKFDGCRIEPASETCKFLQDVRRLRTVCREIFQLCEQLLFSLSPE
jgi:ABC-type lipoprotein export system ATPase subunit